MRCQQDDYFKNSSYVSSSSRHQHRMATLVVGLEASDDASVVLSLSQEVYTDICAWLPPAAGKARGRGRRDGVGSGGSYDQESAKITLDSTRRVLEAMTEWAAGGGDGAGADETREAISLLLAAAATLRGALGSVEAWGGD